MYFPFYELYGWRKRSAVQPQTIDSEFPWGKLPQFIILGIIAHSQRNFHPFRRKFKKN